MSLANTLRARVTAWKAKSQGLAAYVRSRRWLIACFLIALYYLAWYPGKFLGWAWQEVQYEGLYKEVPWRELFTWEGLTRTLLELANRVRPLTGWRDLDLPVAIVSCAIAMSWLHSTPWKRAFGKLGLPRPRLIELAVPLAAAIPGLLFVLLSFLPDPNPDPEQYRSPLLSLSLLNESLFLVLPIGLLYRGLVTDAAWSRKSAYAAVFFIMELVPFISALLEGYTIPFIGSLLAYSAVVAVFNFWLFERWQRRVWSLIALQFGTIFSLRCIPGQTAIDLDLDFYLPFRLAPYVLLAIWTLWRGAPLAEYLPRTAQA